MVKAILLDIDGVIVGDKIGINSPFPHPLVTQKLKEIRQSGIPIILCTAKPHYAIEKIITDSYLNNPHITDGGAIIIDTLSNKLLQEHVMDKKLVSTLLKTYLDAGMYVEIYTKYGYMIHEKTSITQRHTHILQYKPTVVNSLLDEAAKQQIIKVMPVAVDDGKDLQKLFSLFEPFKNRATLGIGIHPVANPLRFGTITSKTVSKKQAAIDVLKTLNIPMDSVLGIGDSTTDWHFMEICEHTAAPENATAQLKRLVHYIGPSVDENGILNIFSHFSL